MPDTTFAARLAALRTAAGLTQYRLAALAGVHRGYLAELERGEKQPSWDVVKRLADALNVGIGKFRSE